MEVNTDDIVYSKCSNIMIKTKYSNKRDEEGEKKISEVYFVNIPKELSNILNIKKGNKMSWMILKDGSVNIKVIGGM